MTEKNNISYIQLNWAVHSFVVLHGGKPVRDHALIAHTATGQCGCTDKEGCKQLVLYVHSLPLTLYLWQFHLGVRNRWCCLLLKIFLLNRIYQKLCVFLVIQNPMEKYEASAVWDSLSPTLAKWFNYRNLSKAQADQKTIIGNIYNGNMCHLKRLWTTPILSGWWELDGGVRWLSTQWKLTKTIPQSHYSVHKAVSCCVSLSSVALWDVNRPCECPSGCFCSPAIMDQSSAVEFRTDQPNKLLTLTLKLSKRKWLSLLWKVRMRSVQQQLYQMRSFSLSTSTVTSGWIMIGFQSHLYNHSVQMSV